MRRGLAFPALLTLLLLLGLCGTAAADLLIYDNNTVNHRAQDAAVSLGLAFTVANVSNFNTLLVSGTWDAVIVDAPSTFPDWNPLIGYIAAGGRVAMSFWTLQTQPALAAAFNVSVASTFAPPQNVLRWDAGHPIFTTPNAVGDLTSWTDQWADDGDRLNVLAGGSAVAGFTASPTAGQAGIVIGNMGRTIYNGFLWDEANDPAGTNLVANEISFLLGLQQVPEPASLAMLGMSTMMIFGFYGRRRRGVSYRAA